MNRNEFRLGGKTLLMLRMLFDIPQKEMAKMIGLSDPALSNIEKGRSKLNRKHTEKVFEILQVDENVIVAFDKSITTLTNQLKLDEILIELDQK